MELGFEHNHLKILLLFHEDFFVTKSTLILNFWTFKNVIARLNYQNMSKSDIFGRFFCPLICSLVSTMCFM